MRVKQIITLGFFVAFFSLGLIACGGASKVPVQLSPYSMTRPIPTAHGFTAYIGSEVTFEQFKAQYAGQCGRTRETSLATRNLGNGVFRVEGRCI